MQVLLDSIEASQQNLLLSFYNGWRHNPEGEAIIQLLLAFYIFRLSFALWLQSQIGVCASMSSFGKQRCILRTVPEGHIVPGGFRRELQSVFHLFHNTWATWNEKSIPNQPEIERQFLIPCYYNLLQTLDKTLGLLLIISPVIPHFQCNETSIIRNTENHAQPLKSLHYPLISSHFPIIRLNHTFTRFSLIIKTYEYKRKDVYFKFDPSNLKYHFNKIS